MVRRIFTPSIITSIRRIPKMVEKAVVVKEAIQQKDKDKLWRAVKESPIHTWDFERWKATKPRYGDHIKVKRFGYTHLEFSFLMMK